MAKEIYGVQPLARKPEYTPWQYHLIFLNYNISPVSYSHKIDWPCFIPLHWGKRLFQFPSALQERFPFCFFSKPGLQSTMTFSPTAKNLRSGRWNALGWESILQAAEMQIWRTYKFTVRQGKRSHACILRHHQCWLTDRLTDRPTDCLTDWLSNWVTIRLTDWLIDCLSCNKWTYCRHLL